MSGKAVFVFLSLCIARQKPHTMCHLIRANDWLLNDKDQSDVQPHIT